MLLTSYSWVVERPRIAGHQGMSHPSGAFVVPAAISCCARVACEDLLIDAPISISDLAALPCPFCPGPFKHLWYQSEPPRHRSCMQHYSHLLARTDCAA